MKINWNPRNDANAEAVPPENQEAERVYGQRVEPTERERMMLTKFAEYIFGDVDFDDTKFVDSFLETDLAKSIPPAMPSIDQAEKEIQKIWSEPMDTSEQVESAISFQNGAMAMYDWITKEREK